MSYALLLWGILTLLSSVLAVLFIPASLVMLVSLTGLFRRWTTLHTMVGTFGLVLPILELTLLAVDVWLPFSLAIALFAFADNGDKLASTVSQKTLA